MEPSRPRAWLVVPAMALASGGLAIGLAGATALGATAVALVGAALASAVRALCGDGPAAVLGAVLAAVLGCLGLCALAATEPALLVRAGIAGGAAVWTIAELGTAVSLIELAALGTATIATVLDPACAPLIVVAGARLITGNPRRRWGVAVMIGGGLTAALAAWLAVVHPGSALWTLWGGAARPVAAGELAAGIGEVLGPIGATAAIGGLCVIAGRGRWPALAILPVAVGAVLVAARAGAVGGMIAALAALAAGVAVARLAGLVRVVPGQLAVGAVAALLLVLPAAWPVAAHDRPAATGKVALWTSSAVITSPRLGPARRSRSATSMAFTSDTARCSTARSHARGPAGCALSRSRSTRTPPRSSRLPARRPG